MTEFTSEWIAQTREQLKLVSPLPWHACSCGKCGMITGEKDLIATATRGDWGDDYPIIKPVGGSIGGQYEVVTEQITYGHIPPETGNINAQYIAEACTNYPEALDHIERLQKRVDELEATISNQSKLVYKFKNMASDLQSENDFLKNNPEAEKYYYQKWVEGKQRIAELEAERRWIPVSERLPEDTRIYDVAIADYEYSWTGSCVFGKWIGESGKAILGVTHWKYRTQPPQEVE